jgi:hypothetical protein
MEAPAPHADIPSMRTFSRVLCIALIGAASRLSAETLLLAVSETIDGVPAPKSPPAIEGIFDGLFEAGHIVFDLGSGKAIPPMADLADIAVSGGAEYVLQAAVAFTIFPREGGNEVSATAQFSVIRAGSVTRVGAWTVSDTNKGREKDVDLSKLGFELGAMIAAKVNGILSSGGGS